MYVILCSVIHFIIEVPCTANYQQINVLCSVAYCMYQLFCGVTEKHGWVCLISLTYVLQHE